MRRLRVVAYVLAGSFLLAPESWGAPPPAAMSGVPIFVCRQQPGVYKEFTVDHDLYLSWLLDTHKVSRMCSGQKAEDTIKQLAAALAPPGDKAAGAEKREPRHCTSDDQAGLRRAAEFTYDLLTNEKQGFSVRGLSSNQKASKADRPQDVVIELKDYYIRCREHPGLDARAAREAEEGRPLIQADKLSELAIGGWKVKLRKDQDSLYYDKKSAGYKQKARGAELSVARNDIKDQQRYDIAATVGLDPGWTALPGQDHLKPRERHLVRVLPYVRRDIEMVRPKGRNDVDIDRTMFGLMGFYYLPVKGTLWDSLFSLDTQYIEDKRATDTAELWAATLKWKPRLGFVNQIDDNLPGGRLELFNGTVVYRVESGPVVRYGDVFNSGGDVEFAALSTFLFYGGEVDVTFVGAKGERLEPFKVALHYHWLSAAHGPYERLEKFVGEVKYALDTNGDFEIGVKYERGRDYQTFVDVDGWKAGLSYKF